MQLTLTNKQDLSKKISKLLITLMMIISAIILPQVFHAIGGNSAGARFLPMHIPVILVGIFCGAGYGFLSGVLSPLFSFCITETFFGTAMPNEVKLPIMIIELSIYGFTTGLFSDLIKRKPVMVLPVVAFAQFVGRFFVLILNLILGVLINSEKYSSAEAFNTFSIGMAGVVLQWFVSLVFVIVRKIKDKKSDK